MRRWSWLGLLLAACGGGEDPASTEGDGSAAQPVRIVLISLDTLRGDHFTPERMPLTWARAEQGRIFTRHYSASSTTQPTHATVFTGLAPWEHGVERNGLQLDPAHETLAERLSAEGFDTRAVVASYPLHPVFGFDRGFDDYDADFTLKKASENWSGAKMQVPNFYSLGHTITDRALDALDGMDGERQFLFLHYFDAHGPYGDNGEGAVPTSAIVNAVRRGGDVEGVLAGILAGYEQDVRVMDQELERLFARLDQDEVPTHVIVFADHGESLGEGGWIGHGKDLTPEQILVPCFVIGPGVTAGRDATPVGSVDVYATVLSAAGLPRERSLGRDLAGALERAPVFGMRRTFVQPFRDLRLDGSYRLVDGKRFFLVDQTEVYEGDAESVLGIHGTSNELSAERTEQLRTLFQRFSDELDELEASEVTDGAVQDALRAMGYAR